MSAWVFICVFFTAVYPASRKVLARPVQAQYIKRQVMTGNLNLGSFKNVQTLNPWVWIRLPNSKRKSKRRKKSKRRREPETEFSGVLIE